MRKRKQFRSMSVIEDGIQEQLNALRVLVGGRTNTFRVMYPIKRVVL